MNKYVLAFVSVVFLAGCKANVGSLLEPSAEVEDPVQSLLQRRLQPA